MEWLYGLWELVKLYLGFKADTQKKEQQETGEIIKDNSDLTAALSVSTNELKALENKNSVEEDLTHHTF